VRAVRGGARVCPAARVRPLVPRPLRPARREPAARERQRPPGRAVPRELGIRDDRVPRVRHVRRLPGQNARWTDNSLQAIERRKRELQEPLAVVEAIRRDRLSPADRLNYDLFRRGLEEQIEGARFKDEYFTITQLGGVQQDVGQLLPQMPTTSVQDYENILARLNGVPALVDQTIVLLGKGLEAGITPPRVTLRDVPDQIRGLTPDDPMASPLLRPFVEFPSTIPVGERERLARSARDAYAQRVAPAYRKLYDYVTGTYVPKTRESIGMRELPDGVAWYAYRVRQFTTTSLSPDQIHALGLREVKRIRALMDSVIASTGFQGKLRRLRALPSDRSAVFSTMTRPAWYVPTRHREARRPGADQAVRQAATSAVRCDDDPVVHGEVPDHGLLPGRLAPGRPPGVFLRQYLRSEVTAQVGDGGAQPA